MGVMWWAEVQRKQFILRLYYYAHLRKQTAWKQIAREGEEGDPPHLQLYINWIDLIKVTRMWGFFCLFFSRSLKWEAWEDMHVAPNEFLQQDERNGECAI